MTDAIKCDMDGTEDGGKYPPYILCLLVSVHAQRLCLSVGIKSEVSAPLAMQ